MLNEKNRKWLKAAGVRAVKTTAQAAIAGIVSVLTSVAGLPEVEK